MYYDPSTPTASGQVAAADRSGQWAVDRTRSLNTWVQLATRSSVAAAGTKIGAARVSDHIPDTMAAFSSGDTTLEHVSMIARATTITHLNRTTTPTPVTAISQAAPATEAATVTGPSHATAAAVAAWADQVRT